MKKNKIETIIKILIMIISLIIPIFIEKYIYPTQPFSVDRFIIMIIIFIFIACNIIFDHKKIWNFIYRYRYIVAVFLFAFLVINGYHGSSIEMYNQIIQPNNNTKQSTPIIGKARFIRTDEYAVDTMGILSQVNYNDLKQESSYLMSGNINVEVFPNLPTKGLGTLTNPRYIGFLLLPTTEMGFSFYWYLPLFVSFMGLFEFFMLITKNKKTLSLLGTVIICFSPSVLWWNWYQFVMYGMLAFHFFRLFLLNTDWKKKLLFSILLGWAGSCYIMILYPAWQLTYGYIYLGLFIWQIISYKKTLKWSHLLYLIPCIMTIIILVLPQFMNAFSQIMAMLNTEYPGSRNIIGGENWERNFLYIPSIFYPFVNIDNPCEFSQILSLYPLPILVGGITVINNLKKHKKDILLIILMILSVFFSIFNYLKVPFLSKITLMTMVPGARITVVLNIVCVFIFILLLGNYEKRTLKKDNILLNSFIALFTVIIATYVSNRYILNNSTINYLTINKAIVSIIIFYTISIFFLINYKKYNEKYFIILIMINLFLGLSVYPISRGFTIIYEKPVSKEIQKIVKKDKDALWMSIDTEFQVPNYLVANGARTINSVNYLPNYKTWDKLDPKHKYNSYYNRYAHILVTLTNEKTSYQLQSADLLMLTLNDKDACKLNVNYLLSKSDLKQNDFSTLSIKELYNQDGIYIYRTNCNKEQ